MVIQTVLHASKISLLLLVSLLLTGCVNHSRFSSLDGPHQQVQPTASNPESALVLAAENPMFYLVKPGDTLYSIAFRFGLEYKKLAAANSIRAPYKIYVGQSLEIKEVNSTAVQTAQTAKAPDKQGNSQEKSSVTKVNKSSTSVRSADSRSTTSSSASWVWPHGGKIVRTFSGGSSSQKGIDLSGRIGDSVLAATNGVVVYAGNGLPGYGNLIILEHPNSLLSAYAFAEQILVKEKDQVKAGQKIATMGKQGDQPSLHFEIRQNGKPVNPLGFLPKR